MQEITSHIFIETTLSGPVLGAVQTARGSILIDAPLQMEQAKSWRLDLQERLQAADRLLVNLDAHPDRTLGVRVMDCTVAAHEQVAQVFRNRAGTFKPQSEETGAAWEEVPNLGTVRWNPPDISFTGQLLIDWGGPPVRLESHPGPQPGAIWVHVPDARTVFVGDLVVIGQPPFLAHAQLDDWLRELELLTTPAFKGYQVIGGRNGLLPSDAVRRMIHSLSDIRAGVENISRKGDLETPVGKLVHDLLRHYPVPSPLRARYEARLRWGLTHYLSRSQGSPLPDSEE